MLLKTITIFFYKHQDQLGEHKKKECKVQIISSICFDDSESLVFIIRLYCLLGMCRGERWGGDTVKSTTLLKGVLDYITNT